MGAAVAMMFSLYAGSALHAGTPAKPPSPPKMSQSVIDAVAQGEVRVLVQVNAPAQKGMSASAVSTMNAVAIDFAHRSPHSYTHIPYLAMTVDASELAQLQNDPRIAGIEEDRPNELTLTDTMPLIGATQGWAAGYTGAGQSIAILDTGFDKTHPMLQGKVVAEACFGTTYIDPLHSYNNLYPLCPNGQNQQIGAGAAINCNPLSGGSMGGSCTHGTHVAGIALGSSDALSGVAPGASLVAIQVFSKGTCSGSPCLTAMDSDILKGLDQAYAWRTTYDIASVNMSLGGGTYTSQATCDSNGKAYKDMFALFNKAGIPVVIASGNSGLTNAISIPGCLTGAISVGSTTKADAIAYYSNSADFLSLLAPGDYIYSSIPGGGYTAMQGTSMAAPHVAGAIAVLKSKLPNASVMQLIEALQNTGVPVTDMRAGAINRVKKRIALFDALNVINANWTCDDYEPDDTPAQARSIGVSAVQTHRFCVPDDRDWVVLQAQAGHIYRFETLNLSSATDTMIALYNGLPANTPVSSNDDVVNGVDLRSVLTYTATTDGLLFLQVQNWDAAAFLNTRYDLQVTDLGMSAATPTATATSTSTSTSTATSTSTSTPTSTSTSTPTPTPTCTATATSTAAETETPTPTATATATATPTPTSTATSTSTSTATATATATATETSTPVLPALPAHGTATPTPTSTATQTATNTATPALASTAKPKFCVFLPFVAR